MNFGVSISIGFGGTSFGSTSGHRFGGIAGGGIPSGGYGSGGSGGGGVLGVIEAAWGSYACVRYGLCGGASAVGGFGTGGFGTGACGPFGGPYCMSLIERGGWTHEGLILIVPGYEFGNCLSSWGNCSTIDWLTATVGLIPGGKGATLGGKGILRVFRGGKKAPNGGMGRSVGAAVNRSMTPSGRRLTEHAFESLERHGFNSLDQVDNIIDGATHRIDQLDGALVHVQRVGRGRKTRYSFIVEGEEGIVTGMLNLTRQEVRNLATNNGWESLPFP